MDNPKSPLINSEVPNMSLTAFHQGKEVKVNPANYRGQWLVLYCYPADFTFVCPTELEEMAGLYQDFRSEGAEVLSVSTDTHFVHKAWHDTSAAIKKIAFPMVADPTGALCRALGTYIPEAGLSYRASFVIDPDGKIKAMEMHDNAVGRSAKELLRKVRAAKFVREHGGEVCPASWTPGEKTLKPGLDLVGKI